MKIFNGIYLVLLILLVGHLHAMDLSESLNDLADMLDNTVLTNSQSNLVKGFGITFTLGSGYYFLENIVRDYCSNSACGAYGCALFFGIVLTSFAYVQDYKKLKRDIKFPIKNILPLLDAIKKRQNDLLHVVQEASYTFIPNALRDFPDAVSVIQEKRNKLAQFMIMAEEEGKLSATLQNPSSESKLFPLRLPKDVAKIVCKYVRESSKEELAAYDEMTVSRYEIEKYRLRNASGRELRE